VTLPSALHSALRGELERACLAEAMFLQRLAKR
jgi:hypothetical protein